MLNFYFEDCHIINAVPSENLQNHATRGYHKDYVEKEPECIN